MENKERDKNVGKFFIYAFITMILFVWISSKIITSTFKEINININHQISTDYNRRIRIDHSVETKSPHQINIRNIP